MSKEQINISYLIPHHSFFTKDTYGRVAHAVGVIEGLLENNFNVLAVAEPNIVNFLDLDKYSNLTLLTIDKKSLLNRIFPYKYIQSLLKSDIVLYRKTLSSFLWISLLRVMKIFSSNKPKVISEINGLFVNLAAPSPSKLRIFLSNVIHRVFLRFDDLVQVVEEDLRDELTKGIFRIPKEKVLVIFNGGPTNDYIDTDSTSQAIKLIFLGNLSSYNEIDLFIKTLMTDHRLLNFHLEVIGDGQFLNSWKAMSSDNKHITFHGYQSFTYLKSLINKWNCRCIGLVPMNKGKLTDRLSPIKGYYYLSLGIPILYSQHCYQDVLSEENVGKLYISGDSESLIQSLLQFTDSSFYENKVREVKEIYPSFTWKSRMYNLISHIQQL